MAANPDRRIKVQWTASRYIWQRYDGIRLRFEIVEAVAMTAHIFAFRMRPKNPKTGDYVGYFSHICSPPDVAEYPEDGPNAGEAPQWFRLPYVDVVIRSREELEKFITDILSDIRRLKATLDIMDDLEPTGSENIGAADSSSSSASSESSGSSEPG